MTFKQLKDLIHYKIIEDMYKTIRNELWNKAIEDYLNRRI